MMVLASRDAQEAAEPEPPRRAVAVAPAKRQRAQPEPEVEPVPVARKAAAAPPPGPKSPTIREFACRFEHDHIDMYLKPQTAEHYRFALARYIIPELGDRQLDDYINREAIAAIRLLALTGMRRDEVRDLRWEQVDWRRSILRLPDTKTGKRDVVVSDEVMDLLGRIAQAKGNPRQGLVVCSALCELALGRAGKHDTSILISPG
jgi:integrase